VQRPWFVINPPADADFTRLVHELGDGDGITVQQLEQALRKSYPRAVVRERMLSGEDRPMWYVYREGRWIPNE